MRLHLLEGLYCSSMESSSVVVSRTIDRSSIVLSLRQQSQCVQQTSSWNFPEDIEDPCKLANFSIYPSLTRF